MIAMRSTAEQEQLKRLRQSRAVATGMLAIAGMVFVVTLAPSEPRTWVLLLRSVAEAALVGGLADWFAVTALFRRPLRLPIPHTAIVPANKDRIGEGLARFLDRHFLTRELLIPELRALRVSERLAIWLADRSNAGALAAEIAKALPFLLRAVDDRQIKAFLGRALSAQLRNAELAPLTVQFVRVMTAAGYHEAVLDRALDYARAFLARNEDRLLETVAERKRSWIPRAINREIARAMLHGAAELIDDLRQPEGAARRSLLSAIDDMAAELVAGSEETAAIRLARLLKQPELQAWIAASWEGPRACARRSGGAVLAPAADACAGDRLDRRNPQHGCRDARAVGSDIRGAAGGSPAVAGGTDPLCRRGGAQMGAEGLLGPDRVGGRGRPAIHPDERHDRRRAGRRQPLPAVAVGTVTRESIQSPLAARRTRR
jgi:uncharacterized membrane-anchored protein YjiN (DUF445 family)